MKMIFAKFAQQTTILQQAQLVALNVPAISTQMKVLLPVQAVELAVALVPQ